MWVVCVGPIRINFRPLHWCLFRAPNEKFLIIGFCLVCCLQNFKIWYNTEAQRGTTTLLASSILAPYWKGFSIMLKTLRWVVATAAVSVPICIWFKPTSVSEMQSSCPLASVMQVSFWEGKNSSLSPVFYSLCTNNYYIYSLVCATRVRATTTFVLVQVRYHFK